MNARSKKGIAVYGSTGSIGTQTLDVLRRHGEYEIVSLVCNSNVGLLIEQAREFRPKYAAVVDKSRSELLRLGLEGTGIKTLAGQDEAIGSCTGGDVGIVVSSTVGISGLVPNIEFIKNGKDVALANKETLVTAGGLVMGMRHVMATRIYPIDSEHSAIWQCMHGERPEEVEKLIITASGGPFRNRKRSELKNARKEDALKHPTWTMGGRITIDSSTLMNKGFEIIEASWLFGIPMERVEVVVHPQSIVHSLVQFRDGSMKAQLGLPDMRLPIEHAIYRTRNPNPSDKRLDLTSQRFEFYKPDEDTFGCLGLARMAAKIGGTMPAVLNGADEMAVDLFLKGRIGFLDIEESVRSAMDSHSARSNPSLEDILDADKYAREHVAEMHGLREFFRR